ncbi:phage head closure protein [Limosilactobacillus mucosae]|uniref:Head-tail adaptor protein n=1 Tax=Limosilactobacillus mucosae TaxID=97478 RepID=A0A508YS98_LIMMU|nr:phage head closure protein [Limosilactobacillus mucosae]VTZ91461.1 hypothetical protein LMUP508_01442 [Limosilactobacillus mucosae]
MTKAINPSRMRFRIEFGKEKATDQFNPNTGKPIKGFVPEFERWAGQWSLTQTQQITLAGAGITKAVVFFIRHDSNITDEYEIRKDGDIFTIHSIAYDDGLTADGFDLITCQKVVKHS